MLLHYILIYPTTLAFKRFQQYWRNFNIFYCNILSSSANLGFKNFNVIVSLAHPLSDQCNLDFHSPFYEFKKCEPEIQQELVSTNSKQWLPILSQRFKKTALRRPKILTKFDQQFILVQKCTRPVLSQDLTRSTPFKIAVQKPGNHPCSSITLLHFKILIKPSENPSRFSKDVIYEIQEELKVSSLEGLHYLDQIKSLEYPST